MMKSKAGNADKNYLELFNSIQNFSPEGIYLWGMPIRKATRERWYKEGLPRDVDPLEYHGVLDFQYSGDMGRMDPPFEKQVLEETDTYQIWVDETGATRKDFKEGLDSGFVTRSYLRFVVQNEKDFENIKQRYKLNSARLMWSDKDLNVLRSRQRPVSLTIAGLFWTLRDWLGFENLCMWFYDHEKLVRRMLQFSGDFLVEEIDQKLSNLAADVAKPDLVIINEDMAYKGHPMIGPEMMRDFMGQHYKRIADVLRKHGIKYIYIDCDGDPTILIPVWFEAGINGIYPVEIAAGIDPVALNKEYGRDLYIIGGIDKRELAKGKQNIRDEVRSRLLPLASFGGYLPGVDHAVPADVSFENHAYYVECVREVEKELFG